MNSNHYSKEEIQTLCDEHPSHPRKLELLEAAALIFLDHRNHVLAQLRVDTDFWGECGSGETIDFAKSLKRLMRVMQSYGEQLTGDQSEARFLTNTVITYVAKAKGYSGYENLPSL